MPAVSLISNTVLALHPDDDVAIALRPIAAGAAVTGVTARVAIPAAHKMAIRSVALGAPLRRYGQIIGTALQPIEPGDHVHTHNLGFDTFARDYAVGSDVRATPIATPRTFPGIVRADGRVATRNYIGVLSTVNCSASVVRFITQHFTPERLGAYANVDGVVPLTHGVGCGMDSNGQGIDVLRRTIAGYARHANFAGVVIIGLGCEANQMDALFHAQGLTDGSMLQPLIIQERGGTKATVAAAIEAVEAMLSVANRAQRTPCSVGHITVGLQCGGSDGYSGITANPALGAAGDRLVALGGTVILSETPEVYGAEHLLTRRAVSQAVADKLIARIRWWEGYTARNGGSMDNNPSPGNKAGGLTTILEKSLGAVAKGGTTALKDVYEYAEAVTEKGFVFMDTPGYDPVSVTGQVAGGANVVCFTTGRGSVYGCRPSPSIKLATNSALYHRMTDDMDINCGDMLEGVTVDQKADEILERIIAVAGGAQSLSEQHGMGNDEFVPWYLGAVM